MEKWSFEHPTIRRLTSLCRHQLPPIAQEAGVTDGECQLGACTRVALISLTVSASFGLAGCAAIDDLKVSISQWLNTGNLTGEGEVPYVNAPGASRVIPPENIPKQATQAPRKQIRATARKLQRPRTVVLPAKKFPRDGTTGRNRGAIRPTAQDAIEDYLPRNAAVIRREVLPQVLEPARKS